MFGRRAYGRGALGNTRYHHDVNFYQWLKCRMLCYVDEEAAVLCCVAAGVAVLLRGLLCFAGGEDDVFC